MNDIFTIDHWQFKNLGRREAIRLLKKPMPAEGWQRTSISEKLLALADELRAVGFTVTFGNVHHPYPELQGKMHSDWANSLTVAKNGEWVGSVQVDSRSRQCVSGPRYVTSALRYKSSSRRMYPPRSYKRFKHPQGVVKFLQEYGVPYLPVEKELSALLHNQMLVQTQINMACRKLDHLFCERSFMEEVMAIYLSNEDAATKFTSAHPLLLERSNVVRQHQAELVAAQNQMRELQESEREIRARAAKELPQFYG